MSQIDMVVWRDGFRELQVCGDLMGMDGEGNAASSTDPQSFLVVVRQGDNVATVHGVPPFDPKAFDPTTGRWEFKATLESQGLFEPGRPAVVSAVVILKHEPAGLETLSWVQPVEIKPDRQAGDEQQLEFHPESLAHPPDRDLAIGHSVSSTLAIHQNDAAGGATYRGLQRIDKLPPAIHLST